MLVEFDRVSIHSNDAWPITEAIESSNGKVFINPAQVVAVLDHRIAGSSVIRLNDGGRKGFIVAGTAAEVAGKLDGHAPTRSRSRAQPRLVAPSAEPAPMEALHNPPHVSGEE